MNTYKHSGGYGDMILGLPVVMNSGGEYLVTHEQVFRLGKLFEVQPYMTTRTIFYDEWKTAIVTHDLNLFRTGHKESIAECYLEVFNIDFDLSKPWLFNIPENKVAKVVLHDTGFQRFPGRTVNWELLRNLEKDCIFIGNSWDYELFKRDRKLDIEYYKTKDLYEVARVISGCKLFIGNQSAPYTIAEGLKKTLVIDLYEGKPQQPFGKNGFTGLSVSLLEESLL